MVLLPAGSDGTGGGRSATTWAPARPPPVAEKQSPPRSSPLLKAGAQQMPQNGPFALQGAGLQAGFAGWGGEGASEEGAVPAGCSAQRPSSWGNRLTPACGQLSVRLTSLRRAASPPCPHPLPSHMALMEPQPAGCQAEPLPSLRLRRVFPSPVPCPGQTPAAFWLLICLSKEQRAGSRLRCQPSDALTSPKSQAQGSSAW